ncbi:preprotein translocase subunit SecE [Adlercreutzia sp. ZJ242]|uniref:preprotein translocase subunit SecE n=1 Tax=Adlercreutzia sp. ZJ242 TaxID=2709409 RepID=UPI0013EB8F99|nr:preprotein translocase subunit SecE [Adlercreutzia sp. ZJ242]
MAKKSKTQRAKASAARQQRKAAREQEELNPSVETTPAVEEAPKKSLFKKTSDDAAAKSPEPKGSAKKAEEKKPKKKRFKFLREVRSEMKRVTWPTRTDVLRWSGVVVVALLFFGVFVALLDNAIITPLLVLISGIGA